MVLAPWIAHSMYSYVTKDDGEKDLSRLMIFPVLLLKVVQGQLWISLARFQTARGKHRIVNKGLEFEQVDREMNWYSLISTHAHTYSGMRNHIWFLPPKKNNNKNRFLI